MEKIKYAVIGSGRQGIACAYDLAKNGNADCVLLLDIELNTLTRNKNLSHYIKNTGTDMDKETRKDFSDYLTDQRTLSEYSELLFAVQENSEVTRTN